ncbi:rho GTPase-activating protein 27-like isoform X3 [Mizuhopecten yessoensis]|uniref:rho GTPase-activating protein 27-like isoform X3 n=1 Tax=Mizuhopecten yessoensis TaxID=6573 RepID=UPI000B45AF76|nr:rho GTPase-activating protein 27-like isoform X3 [Mizuhopecten yessoensis]
MGDNSDHDGSDEEDYIGFGFATRKLAALYDYTYVDDSGKTVHMTKGEEYHLLEKSNDWWEVFRAGDSTDLSFYVPANYVKFVDDSESKAKTKQTSDSDFEGDPGSEMSSLGLDTRSISPSLKNGVSNADDTEGNHKPDKAMDIYANSNVSTFMTNNNVDVSSKNGSITVRPGMYRRSLSTDDGGDYMNLETLREQAGLPSAPRPPLQDGESIYANVQELNIEPQVKFTLTAPSQSPPVSPEEPPIPDEKNCPFLRTLLNVWEMYLDPITKRSFYINKETNEKTWKPPRYPKKSRSVRDTASSHYNSQLREKVELPKSAPVSVRVERSSIPDGWTVETTEGNQYFINKRTQEKWGTHTDENGKPYFYKLDTGETAWQLPEVTKLLTSNGDPTSANIPRSRSPQRIAPQNPRSVKTQSMYLESHLNFGSFQGQLPGGLMSKSSTLPVNPSSVPEVGGLPKSQTLPYNLQGLTPGNAPHLASNHWIFQMELEKKVFHPGTSNQGQEKICGMLKKRMIVELGKQVKKSFSPSFVKLLGTNLVFYKNRQASTQQGSKHGKPEFMEPLQGAHIDKYPHKRHLNVLVLSTCNKNQYQLQLEDEIDMQKWLSTLELTIKELGPCMVDQQLLVLPGNSDSLKKTPSFKQKNRKPSEKEETPEEEKSRFKSIFERWMKDPQRPTKKQLEDKGIIEYNVFGGSLKQVCEKDKAKVPKFVQRCIAAIEKRGLDQDGLYRISGNMAQITKLRSMTNMDKFDYDLDNPDLWDIHVLAGALKLFFRELKEPLFALAQFDKFILAIGKKSRLDKLKGLKEQVNALPKYNYETLKFLCGHLIRVADRQSVNKMSFHNLAIVYGPTLMWKEMDTNFMAHMVLQSQIVEFVLLEYKNIFK